MLSIINIFILLSLNNNYRVTAKFEQIQYDIRGLAYKNEQSFKINGNYSQNFLLGLGNVYGESKNNKYYFYFKENEYGCKLEYLPANEVYIREKEDDRNYLIWVIEQQTYPGHPILNKFFPLIKENDCNENIVTEKILQVPAGTIQIDYNIEV